MSDTTFDLHDHIAVVTGGSGVLGGAMAKDLLDAGARVCILGRDLGKAQSAAQALSARRST